MLLHANPQEFMLTTSNKHMQRFDTEEEQYQRLLQSCISLFQKPYEHRTANELLMINKVVLKINFFKALEKYASTETVKSVLKFGKIVKLDEAKLIYEADSYLDYFVVALTGKYGLINQIQQDLMVFKDQENYHDYFEHLKNFTSQYLQFLKKKETRQSKAFKPAKINIHQVEIKKAIHANLDNQILFINKTTFQNKTQVKKIHQSIVTLGQQNYIFKIEFRKFCEIMREQYNKGILKQMEIFLTFNCFKLFKKEKLKQMVEELEVKKLKKGNVLFAEGQEDRRIFILTKGEVILERMVCLGQQNPNTLYKNRLSIKRSSYKNRGKDKISVIPFADFTKVYNSSSQLKAINLSRVTPVSILGEEEVISQNPRQTTTKVTSLSAEMYVFTVQEIAKYFTSDSQLTVQDFLRVLAQQITEKKILYRQQKLGGEVEYQNKNSKNGFYLSQHESKTVRVKKNIAQFNKTIPCRPQNKSIEGEDDEQHQMFLTATFNCHNFQQFYESKKYKHLEKEIIKSPELENNKKPEQKIVQLSDQQKEIIKLLHGNQRTIIKPPKSMRAKSEKKSISFPIDLNKPLFTPEYFKEQMERSRKIEHEYKKSRLKNLYSSNLSFNNPKSKTLPTSLYKSKDKTMSSFRRNFSYQV